MSKIIGRSLSGKYSQKIFTRATKIATDAIKTASKRKVIKTAEPTGDLISNKIVYTIIKLSKTLPQSSSSMKENERKNNGLDKEISRKIISLSNKKAASYSWFKSYIIIQ